MVKDDICDEKCEHQAKVEQAKNDTLADGEAQLTADFFKILGDATRLKILYALAQQELCVCDIAAVIGMGQSAVSHQLRILRNVRLVKYRKDGKMAWYSLDDDHVRSMLAEGRKHISHD